MTFEELLDQAIDMLRRRGRVTYRARKLQFHLDDETLDVLKDELLYGQQLAVDEEDRVLVWTGPPATPLAASTPSFAAQDAPLDQTLPVEDVPATAATPIAPVPDAERRQLMVLFLRSSRLDEPRPAARSGRLPRRGARLSIENMGRLLDNGE